MEEQQNLIEMTVEIVAAYVGKNRVEAGDLPNLIHQTYAALASTDQAPVAVPSEPLKPAVPVKRSVTPDYIICLDDGKKFKSLKRHLRTHYDLTPEEYRAKWGLPKDYPMVAPNYAAARSNLAREMGLGQKGKRKSRRSA
jgi:predicted transcriptional regulator